MDYKITEDKIREVAERYGLNVEMSDKPGIYINNEKVNLRELFSDFYGQVDTSNEIEVPIDVTFGKSNINFKRVTADFLVEGFGVV